MLKLCVEAEGGHRSRPQGHRDPCGWLRHVQLTPLAPAAPGLDFQGSGGVARSVVTVGAGGYPCPSPSRPSFMPMGAPFSY